MKKIKLFLLMIITITLLLPITSFAKDRKYVTMDFKETLAAENIELANKDYEENDDQITIYMFRGNNCSICQNFLSYLNSISTSHGKYFKLVSYEIWSNEHNELLFEEVADFFGKQAKGVPFIVIGDKFFDGYDEIYNEDILNAIVEQYNKEDRYDVFEEMEKEKKLEYREDFFKSGLFSTICLVNVIVILLFIVCVILFENIRYKKLENKIEKFEKEISLYNKDNHHKEKKSNDNKKKD